jgi:hypothetical protein
MRLPMMLMVLLASSQTQAAEWMSIGKNTQGNMEALVDVSSIRIAGDIRRVWTKITYAAHTEKGTGADASKWVRYELGHDAFKYDEKTQRNEALVVYYDAVVSGR